METEILNIAHKGQKVYTIPQVIQHHDPREFKKQLSDFIDKNPNIIEVHKGINNVMADQGGQPVLLAIFYAYIELEVSEETYNTWINQIIR